MSEARYISAVERLLYLKNLPSFGDLPPQQLAVVAQHVQEHTFARGQVLVHEGRPVDAVHLLVRGRVDVFRGGKHIRAFAAGDEVGGMALLAGEQDGVHAVAKTSGLALTLKADALFDIFEDHFPILDHVLTSTARVLRGVRMRMGPDAGIPAPSGDSRMVFPDRPLDLVDRMFVLQRAMPFAGASITGLAELAQRAREVRHGAGHRLWDIGSDSEYSYQIVSGTVRCTSPSQSFRLGPGDIAGVIDLVSGQPHVHDAVSETPTIGLAIDRGAMTDVFEDHFQMAAAALRGLGRAVLLHFERLGPDQAEQAEPAAASA